MLYDKKWDTKPATRDPLSLEGLVAWLEKQPAKRRYCYMNNGDCLHAQYLRAVGVPVKRVGGTYYRDHDDAFTDLPMNFILVAREKPHTFGAALARARAALAGSQ